MKNLKIKSKVNQYMKNGSPVFVYTVDGNAETLREFKESQGSYYRETEAKEPMYFSRRIIADGSELVLTASGRFQVLQDLEAITAAQESATTTAFGKIQAIQQYSGLTKAQLAERLISSFAG